MSTTLSLSSLHFSSPSLLSSIFLFLFFFSTAGQGSGSTLSVRLPLPLLCLLLLLTLNLLYVHPLLLLLSNQQQTKKQKNKKEERENRRDSFLFVQKAKRAINAIPMARLGTPEEVAEAILWYAKHTHAYISFIPRC